MSSGQGREGVGEWCLGGAGTPHHGPGSRTRGFWGLKENRRRNERSSTLLVGLGSPKAWCRVWGSLYLLPVGVPQNVAAHDVDDVRLWVHFAHQATQALPEAGGGELGHRRPPAQARTREEGRPPPGTWLQGQERHAEGLWGRGVQTDAASTGRPAHSLDHVLFLLHFGKGGHFVLEQVKVSWAALSETLVGHVGREQSTHALPPSRRHVLVHMCAQRLHIPDRSPPLHPQQEGAEPYLAENQHLPDLGPLVVDIQLFLYFL